MVPTHPLAVVRAKDDLRCRSTPTLSDQTAAVAAAAPAGPLTAATMATLTAFFAAIGNQPSADQFAALGAVAATMEAMANGTCAPALYLAALDPGSGRPRRPSTSLVLWWLPGAHRDVGMVICLGRLSQIEAVAKEIDLPRGSMAVLTANEELNALSTAPVDDAQDAPNNPAGA